MTGGLGNQLFEYALARNINLMIPGSELHIDTSSYKKYKIRRFELDKCNITKDAIISDKEINGLKKLYFLFWKSLHRLLFKLTRKKKNGVKIFSDRVFQFCSKFGALTCLDISYHKINYKQLSKRRNIYIYGFYQSPKYFKENLSLIKRECIPVLKNSNAADEFIKKYNNVSKLGCFSFRCSELKKMGLFIDDLEPGFIDRASNKMRELKTDATILLTEDPDNAKLYLEDYDKYIKGCSFSPHEQLCIMMQCNKFVISNSSFSWWGAFLSNKKDKSIYCPRVWYKNILTESTELLTEDMIAI